MCSGEDRQQRLIVFLLAAFAVALLSLIISTSPTLLLIDVLLGISLVLVRWRREW